MADGAGMWQRDFALRTCALKCALSRRLKFGNEVILYDGTGSGARGPSPTMVYLALQMTQAMRARRWQPSPSDVGTSPLTHFGLRPVL